ncbi:MULTISPECIES: ThuA domain-containing protein [unclassified Microbacterium]|uniref:ThuA domain-containing protein n=1 Tax=unclassified Microbacterium TaxID=2609290 RepID=UPI0030101839
MTTTREGRRALIVRGGWEGHRPVEATEMFLPFLEQRGFDVRIEESNEVYADRDEMDRTDLIVQCVTMSEISADALKGLRGAVERGTGLAGWHGGIADSYRDSSDYLQLIGGQFATHPSKHPDAREGDERDNFLCYTVDLTELGRSHEIMAGVEDFTLRTEQYWVLSDDLNDVLATTTHSVQPYHPWQRPITSPAVWTREWGQGRVFVATPGHSLSVLRDVSVRTIIERGMLWATRSS